MVIISDNIRADSNTLSFVPFRIIVSYKENGHLFFSGTLLNSNFYIVDIFSINFKIID